MVEKDTVAKADNLVPTYIVAIVAAVLAAVLGAMSVGTAIALLSGQAVSFPGFIGLMYAFSDGLVAPVALAIAAVLAAVAALLAFGKITKSAGAAELTKSAAYRVMTTIGILVPAFFGACLVVYAVAVAVATLLAVQNGLPWAAYYLGQFLPILLMGGGLIGAALMVKLFSHAKLAPKILSIIVLSVAALGCLLVLIAVGVKSHSDDASKLFNIDRPTTVKSVYDYYGL